MSLETYLNRIVKPNDIPYVKQALKEWLLQKRQEYTETPKYILSSRLIMRTLLDELLEELQK